MTITKLARYLEPGDVFHSEERPDKFTCIGNRGEHFMYGWLINTAEVYNLAMNTEQQLTVTEGEVPSREERERLADEYYERRKLERKKA